MITLALNIIALIFLLYVGYMALILLVIFLGWLISIFE